VRPGTEQPVAADGSLHGLPLNRSGDRRVEGRTSVVLRKPLTTRVRTRLRSASIRRFHCVRIVREPSAIIGHPSGVWVLGSDGSRPRKIAAFDPEQVFEVQWLGDGASVAIRAGVLSNDTVLIRKFR
jgi:hypothetical protein